APSPAGRSAFSARFWTTIRSMRARRGSSRLSSSISTSSPTPARSDRSSSSETISRRSGAASVDPSETTSRPVSSSLRKSTSSISSSISSTSARICSSEAAGSLPGRLAPSISASRRASGVRSACETAAVKPTLSSLYGSAFTLNKVGAMTKVLIVEDDEVIASGMAQHLSGAGFDPVTVGRGEIGLARLRYEAPDVVVLDLMLPGLDGWSLIEAARAEGIGTPIIVVSARGTEHDRVHVTTRDELLQRIWGRREMHRDRTVDVFVRRLRDKIDRAASRHTFIQTRYGVGYKLEPIEKGSESEE